MPLNESGPIRFTVLQPTGPLAADVDVYRIAEYEGTEALAIKVCPNGSPGILFQHRGGRSCIERIETVSGRTVPAVPTFFLHGPITELSIMYFKPGPFATVQAILKPHALKSLFGFDASRLTNGSVPYGVFADEEAHRALLGAGCARDCVEPLERLLIAALREARPRDELIEESLRIVRDEIETVTVKSLRERLHLSERQFEKRFMQTVGVTPQLYIRVKRFNEAIRLMDTGRYERLIDVAHALRFHDQSHFIRDIKTFSGITPKSVLQKVNHFHRDQIGSSYFV